MPTAGSSSSLAPPSTKSAPRRTRPPFSSRSTRSSGAARRRDRERRAVLREANVDLVVGALAEPLAAQLEEARRQKSHNELGALLLSEQVRKLSDALSSRSSGSVRHQFGRLTHLAFVLNVGSLQEAAALLMSTMGAAVKGGEAAPPRLSRAEAVRVLGLRVEFNVAELREMMPDLAEEEAEEEAKRAEKELPW